MKILILTDEIFPDAIGGIGKSLFNETVALSKRGHDISIIVRSTDHALPENEIMHGMKIQRVNGPTQLSKFYYLYPIIMLYKLIGIFKSIDEFFDIILVYNPIFLIAAHLSGISSRFPIGVIFYSSIAQEVYLNAGRKKYGIFTPLARLAASILGQWERWAFRKSDFILTRSQYSRELLLEWESKANILEEIIPIGLDISQYQPTNQKDAREHLDLPHNIPILVTVRRQVARMGLENLITAVNHLNQKNIPVLLIVIGKGYLQSKLQEQVDQLGLNSHIKLMGFVSEELLPIYLGAADFFILPTEALEGFGLATLEALAVGLPVIGTPIGATTEILNMVEPKLLTQSASPQALTDAIIQWLDENDHSVLKQSCREIVEQNYNSELVAQKLEILFQKWVT